MRQSLHLAVWAVTLGTACDPGDIVLLAPDQTPGSVPALTVHVVLDTLHADLANSLGWPAGIPDAHVRAHLMAEPYGNDYWHVAWTDSTGVAVFPDLLSGLYEVEVTRPLTAIEIGRADSVVRVLAGGRRLSVPRAAQVAVVPDQRGSLVFSEMDLSWPLPWEIPQFVAASARYVEVFNNADTTVYLDGKYFGIAWHLNLDYPAWPCAQTQPVRNDPDGIWVRNVLRFPGGGTDYPLEPGGAALIAGSAIDHRQVEPELPDLRHADFEWRGGDASAGNPSVPNLMDIGLAPMRLTRPGEDDPLFLSEPVDLGTLPQYVDPHSGSSWVRIPAELVLDVSVRVTDWATHSFEATRACLTQTHRSFERLAGPAGALSDFNDHASFQRRIVTVLPDGRKILQDANTSMADFVKASQTPGWIPDSLPSPQLRRM